MLGKAEWKTMEAAKCLQSGLPQGFHWQRLVSSCPTHLQHMGGFKLTIEGSLCAAFLTRADVDLGLGQAEGMASRVEGGLVK